MDHEVLKEIEKALEENKTFDKLTLSADPTLPKEFHCQFVFGNGQSTSLSDMRHFRPESYHCHMDGRLVLYINEYIYIYMSLKYCMMQFCVVYSEQQAIMRMYVVLCIKYKFCLLLCWTLQARHMSRL